MKNETRCPWCKHDIVIEKTLTQPSGWCKCSNPNHLIGNQPHCINCDKPIRPKEEKPTKKKEIEKLPIEEGLYGYIGRNARKINEIIELIRNS